MTAPLPSLLRIEGLGKSFAGVPALEQLDLVVEAGRVHALIGENGAGKSTLIRIIGGALAPDAGRIEWRGEVVRWRGPRDAAARGVAVVHQEPQLVGSLGVLDHLFLGRGFPHWHGMPVVSRAAMRERAGARAAELGIELPLDALVADLSATQATMLGVLRALFEGPRLVVLDEPTAALTANDAQHLLRLVRRLADTGVAVLYVSHRLDEVLGIADSITVLRNGRHVATIEPRGATQDQLVEAMSGRRVAAAAPREPASAGAALLEVEGLRSACGRVRDVSLVVGAGEVVGLYGLAGSGRTELLETLAGLRAQRGGRLRIGGAGATVRDPAAAARQGLLLIPEDRRGHALVGGMRIRENLTLPYVRRFARFGVSLWRAERGHADAMLRDHAVKARDAEQPIVELSGGNQQKVVFARALAMQPRVLLCDEPTQGVDVGARRAIHAMLRAHVRAGGGCLLVTSDLDEMLEVADRIVVLREGRSVATLAGEAIEPTRILQWCFGHGEPDARAAA